MKKAFKCIAVLLLAAMLSPAQAAIQIVEGSDVTYSIDRDQWWLEGLTASVIGNALTFKNSEGGYIAEGSAKGGGYLGVNLYPTNMSRLGGISVQAKSGKQLSGLGSTFDATNSGEVIGSKSAIVGEYFAEVTASLNNAFFGSSTIQSITQVRGTKDTPAVLSMSPMKGSSSFAALTNQKIDLVFFNYASVFAFYGVGRDNHIAASVNSFGVDAQVAAVPEPETYALMGLGLLGLLAARRRQSAK